MNAVEVRELTKRFGDFKAVDGLTFDVEEGEIFGLLGPNGAGKSTLMRMLTTLVVPSSGTAHINGFNVLLEADSARRSIGVIPQAMTSDLELSAEENLLIFAKLYGVPRQRRRDVIGDLLEAVQLSEFAHRPVSQLSGGMRRRLEIARGLVHEPRIFFLDEPTTGLDPVSRTAVWELLQGLKARRGLTVVLSTHYLDEADRLCGRVAIVDRGRLQALDAPARLKAAVPGKDVIEISLEGAPPGFGDLLSALPGVEAVSGAGAAFRIASTDGPRTTRSLIELGEARHVTLCTLSIQGTTLDDVFVHHTGRQLRDAAQETSAANRPTLPRSA